MRLIATFSGVLIALSIAASFPTPRVQAPSIRLIARTPAKPNNNPRKPLRRRAHEAITVPLENFYLGTDLQWYGPLQIGTPAQEVTVVFDTGSYTLEVASDQCDDSCANQTKFVTAKSSTYVDGGEVSEIAFATGVGVDPVVNNDYVLTLESGSDVVGFGGLSAGSVELYTIVSQTAAFGIDPFSGIQGMSSQAQGLFAGLVDNGLPSLFSFYLTPKSSGKEAELTIGGIDSSKYTGELTYASLPSSSDGSWTLRGSKLAVNGRTTSAMARSRDIIFDSGTSNVLFPTAITEQMYSLISSDIKAFDAEPGAYGIPCNKISALTAVIDITFTSTAGKAFNLTIPSSELNVGPFSSDPSTCQTLINAYDGLNLVGGSLLKHYYSVWNVGEQTMGFAPAAL